MEKYSHLEHRGVLRSYWPAPVEHARQKEMVSQFIDEGKLQGQMGQTLSYSQTDL